MSLRSGASRVPPDARVLNFERWSKWNFMSVPRIVVTAVWRASA